MILSNEQTNEFLDNGFYNCFFVNQRFSYIFFKDQSNPLGNIVCFEAPTKIGPLVLNKAIVLITELPNVSIFGGICFQRLFSAQIGSYLTHTLNKECVINQSSMFIDEKQASVVVTNKVKDSVISHIIFPIEGEDERLYKLKPTNEFKQFAVQGFRNLTQSVFIETQRDNF